MVARKSGVAGVAGVQELQNGTVVSFVTNGSEVPNLNGEVFFVLRRRFHVSVPILLAMGSGACNSCLLAKEICERAKPGLNFLLESETGVPSVRCFDFDGQYLKKKCARGYP